jgi:1-acyl-sn-glycerol-3-phosphate acyltransferase
VGFVAKADVAGWPLLGVLAQRHGSVFVDRHRRAGVVEAGGACRAAGVGALAGPLAEVRPVRAKACCRSMPAWFRMPRRIVA